MPNTPDERSAPKASDKLSVGRKPLVRIANSPAGIVLRNLLSAMYRGGNDAEEDYQRLLKEASRHAEEVLVEIARAFADCGFKDYPFRLALVQVATALRHPAALAFFASVVKTPIPEEQSPNPHSFSTVAEETIVRTMAVDGVSAHAAEGNDRAKNLLIDFVRLPSFSIRRAAVQGLLLTTQEGDIRERIKYILPENQHFLLDLRKVHVSEVPQVKDPTRHLKERLREGKIPSPPRFPEGDENGSPKAY